MKKHKYTKTKYIIIIVCLILGYIVGHATGTYTTIKAVAYMSMGFLDEDKINMALYQYDNNIKTCFPSILNASIYDSKGNKT